MIRRERVWTTLGVGTLVAGCNSILGIESDYYHAAGGGIGGDSAGGSTSGRSAGGGAGVTTTSGGTAGSGARGGTSSGDGGTVNAGEAGEGATGATTGGGRSGAGGTPSSSGGAGGVGGSGALGNGGSSGEAGDGGGSVHLPTLVTSAVGAYWKLDGTLGDVDGTPVVAIDLIDTTTDPPWQGFGATFNELGWEALTSSSMRTAAMKLLFSATDGAALAWGRIPIGASDYAVSRYTCDDAGSDPVPSTGEGNRPASDVALANFSLERDAERLIPFIQAAQAVKPDLRFWASPWTPPLWMKTGYRTTSSRDVQNPAERPSYYDGGSMRTDADLDAYARYFTKFVEGYRDDHGINIAVVAPQTDASAERNYPSCMWDKSTYTAFIGEHLGPAMDALGVDIMLGTLDDDADLELAKDVLANPAAHNFLSVIGAQESALDGTSLADLDAGLPVWVSQHRQGNYPWIVAEYNAAQAPNDHAYAVDSWYQIRTAIVELGVSGYHVSNMILNKAGLGIDTSREWKQNALLVADSGTLTPTPAYYVFRHLSQYVLPGAKRLITAGGSAVAFRNPDGSLVAVMYNDGAADPAYVVAFGEKQLQFAMPSGGWATIRYEP